MSRFLTLSTATAVFLFVPLSALAQPAADAHKGAGVEQAGVSVVIEVPHPEATPVPHRGDAVEPPPPPPPPPPPAPQATVDTPSQTPRAAKKAPPKKKKTYRMRIVAGLDMLPIKLDLAVHERVSLHAAFFLVYPGENKNYYAGFLGGVDYYLVGRAPEGLRLGVRGGQIGWGKKKSGARKTRLAVARALIGYNWIWRNGFTLNLGLGMQYLHRYFKGKSGKTKNYIVPHLEFGLGIAF